MNISNMKTNFLYQLPLNRDYMIGGGTDTEYEKWRFKFEDEEIAFGDYLKIATFEDLAFLLIFIYKEKHPAITRLMFRLFEEYHHPSQGSTVYDKPYRNDIIMASTINKNGDLLDDLLMEYEEYEKSIYFEFTEDVSNDIVEDALGDLVYAKTTDNTQVVYNVENSPIATLTLTRKSFKIELNQDYVVQYHKM